MHHIITIPVKGPAFILSFNLNSVILQKIMRESRKKIVDTVLHAFINSLFTAMY